MKIPSCSICSLPVLELEGQFKILQPYFAPIGDEHPAIAIAGWCHSTCLTKSEYGPKWYEWQLQHFLTRGYERAGDVDGWSVLQLSRTRDLLALRVDGTSVGASRKVGGHAGVRCDDGLCIPLNEEYNLELDDEVIIGGIKGHLQRDGEYPIIELCRDLRIDDKLRWPQALEKGIFRFDKKLTRHWERFAVSMRAIYHSFLPEAIVPFWRQLGRLPER